MKSFLLGILLITSTSVFASNDNSTVVTEWANQTLLKAFSIDFNYDSNDTSKFSKRFTEPAWKKINDFIEDYLPIIRQKQITLHPIFLIEPKIVDSGDASGIKYWQVNEEMFFPEIKAKVAFSLMIIESNTNKTFLIQTLNMIKQEKP